MGRDPDSKWAHWLALSRRNKPESMFGTSSSNSFPSSLSEASSNIADRRPLYSHSSATSSFPFLSANEDGSRDARSFASHKQYGNVSALNTRDMDSSWVAWFTERWHQRQLTDLPDSMMPGKAYSSGPSFPNPNRALSPIETQQMQIQKNSTLQGIENAVVSNTATSTASDVFSSAETSSPLLSSMDKFLDPDIDSMGTFTELLSDFSSTLPFDPTNTPANGFAEPCGPAELDDENLAWLEEQHVCPHDLSYESEKSSPTCKRSHEGYPRDCPPDGQTYLENIANKKQKTFHPWTNRLDTSSPFSQCIGIQPNCLEKERLRRNRPESGGRIT